VANPQLLFDLLAVGSGALVGFTLGLVGGGGSILAVPLLVYVVGVGSPHVAIGTSAIAVSATAFANLMSHWREDNVQWRCALVFATSGVVGALVGSSIGKAFDGQKLMVLFGALMLLVGVMMIRRRAIVGDPGVRLTGSTARRLLPMLGSIGFGVGALSGFFGIGGGFLIVPGLMLATGMPLGTAIGTSLVAVTAFGITTAANYAISGLIDWRLAAFFIAGGMLGGFGGVALCRELACRTQALGVAFAGTVIAVGAYVLIRGALMLRWP
jgi:uncharacterized membrane protein YfcA